MEDKKRKDRYVQFPLCLLRETFKSGDYSSELEMILNYGVVKYAKSFKYDLTEVARQLMYAYYRKRDMIQDDLYNTIAYLIRQDKLTTDEDYNGFSGPSFYPDESIQELLGLFESDEELRQTAILRYQIAQSISRNFLNIKLGSIDSTLSDYNKGLNLRNRYEIAFGPDCCPGIKPLMLLNFRDSKKDLELLQAYIGIKSLIGQNNYVSTHKTVILSRMMGCKSNESLTAFLKTNKTAKEMYEKYSGRKRMDNLLFKLMERGFIMMLSKKHESRIYVSARLKTPAELADAILKNRTRNDLKKQIAEASKLL